MEHERGFFKVAPGVWGMKIIFVNIYMIVYDSHWVLVDAGITGSAARIIAMANELFGETAPSAIILTHGHFDHRGALPKLLDKWDVPVFAHRLELPYLTGRSAYPPPDPSVGGGLMSLLSLLYPKAPINLGARIKPLPDDDSVPFLPEWEAIFVPGHAPGQVAFFRTTDRLLIAGDAFVTTRQESAIATLSALPVLSGPPKYFTYDWDAAKASVTRLAELSPRRAATGHGLPMYGEQLQTGLENLKANFDELAMPKRGRYKVAPALVDASGVRALPPPYRTMPIGAVLAGALLTIAIFIGYRQTIGNQ